MHACSYLKCDIAVNVVTEYGNKSIIIHSAYSISKCINLC